jgi:hypothetical protein
MAAYNLLDSPLNPDKDGIRLGEGICRGSGPDDPRVVGVIAPLYSIWDDSSTGIRYIKTGPGETDWTPAPNISVAIHRALDQLVHNIAESGYEIAVYTSGKITSIIFYTESAGLKIREKNYTYVGNLVATETIKQYAADGINVEETLTKTFNYSGSRYIDSNWSFT